MKEGLENDEYLITRLDHVSPPVNIMNVYGGQETRMTNQEILDNWINMKAEIMEFKNRDEGLILIGDINRSIGSDSLGVRGNHASVSYGGTLIREMLEDKEYTLVNNLDLVEGGAIHLGVQGGQQHQELLRLSHHVVKPAALPDQDGGGQQAEVLLHASRSQEQ